MVLIIFNKLKIYKIAFNLMKKMLKKNPKERITS